MNRFTHMVKEQFKNVYIVIPAFNEERIIGRVIDDIRKEGFDNIIVVDDGSTDYTYMIAKKKEAIAIRHLINRGKGAATQTGLDAAKILKADIVVTIDADGQHNSEDIIKLVKPIMYEGYDVTLGSRILGSGTMPYSRKLMNQIANLITFLFYGIYVTDSQSGFRAYNAKASDRIDTTMDRYEFESEILFHIKNQKLRYKEVPIDVLYSEYSMNKYSDIYNFPKQNLLNGFKMFFKMVVRSILS